MYPGNPGSFTECYNAPGDTRYCSVSVAVTPKIVQPGMGICVPGTPGICMDAGVAEDAGVIDDAGAAGDAQASADAEAAPDGMTSTDAAMSVDAAESVDALVSTDAGPGPGEPGSDGCGCSATNSAGRGGALGVLAALFLLRRRRDPRARRGA